MQLGSEARCAMFLGANETTQLMSANTIFRLDMESLIIEKAASIAN